VNVEALQALGAQDEVPGSVPPRWGNTAPVEAGFAHAVSEGLQSLNQQLLTTQVDLQQLALGDATQLHQVMVRLEESRIALQLALQVRNRMLEAYQDVMKMQV
jgi:flagellar hook-basal body complex protein FliE